MEQGKKSTPADKIWEFFASIKLAIAIFALISLTSIVGTILEQKAEPETNIRVLSKIFGDSLGPSLYPLLDKLGFMDMYNAWWFTGLLVLFSVNLIICSLDRLPRIWKLVTEPVKPLSEESMKKLSIHREIILKGKPDGNKNLLSEAFKSARFSFKQAQEEAGYQFFSQKGAYSRLGVYVTHFSILIILIGAIIGIRFGFKGNLNLPEGALSDAAFSGTDKGIPLGFHIRCDYFNVEFYGMSDMPKEYRSWLTIIKDDREVQQKSITVNDPLTYDGITFYQSSYGLVPDGMERGIFIFRIVSRDGKVTNLNLRFGDTFQIPDTTISGRIMDFSPALRTDIHGHVFTYANQMNNPAVLIEFSGSATPKFSQWLLKRQQETWQLPDGNRVEFIDVWGLEFTGLQVRKDPGVWVVYFGCIAMSIGLFIAFFMSHRKIWIKAVEDKNNTRVLVGATANKNRAAFERKIETIISNLRKKQEGVK